MRVIGGRWRGRHLDAPEGRGVTRPTTDRVREAMASMVLAACGLSLTSVHVLDAFAGSGGLGIELLSRGAASATFVEMNRKSAAVVPSQSLLSWMYALQKLGCFQEIYFV